MFKRPIAAKWYIACLLLIFATTTVTLLSAQPTKKTERKGENKIAASYGARFFLNNRDIKNDNVYPNTLSTDKPYQLNHQVILDFQRSTRYGLLYGVGIEYGNRTYSFNVDFKTLELVDRPTQVLYVDYTSKYRLKTGYWGLKPFAGYVYDLQKAGLGNWKIEAKAGVLICLYTKGYVSNGEPKPLAQYFTSDHKMVNVFTETMVQMGNAGQKYSGAVMGELYLGLSRKINKGLVKDVSLGVTFTNYLKYPASGDQIITEYGMSTIITNYYYNGVRSKDKPNSIDYYTPREMSFGLRCSFGFGWPKG